MATVDQLTVSILDMPEQEVFELIKNLRQVRRTRPAAARTYKKSAKGTRSSEAIIKGSGKNVDPMTLLKTLTPAQRKALLKDLGVDT
jgi:hypothetical protein